MKNSAALFALASSLFSPFASATPVATRDSSANPFQGKTLYLDPLYSSQVQAAVTTLQAEGKTDLAAKAAIVAEVPTFIWISQRSDVTKISPILYDAKSIQNSTGKAQAIQLVVYNLPDRDCSAGASAGENTIDNAGESRYEAFVRATYTEIQRVPEVQVIVVLEPDSIGNIITNLGNP
ncbi:glycoside hydrolase family 6 protein, partial [Tulasnella calospora MUT 4182]